MPLLPKLASLSIVAVGLSGCLQPTPLSVASMVLDAGSYAVSGKTLADHGVSGATGQDCAVSRLITEGDVCREEIAYAEAPAILEPLPPQDTASAAQPLRHAEPRYLSVAALNADKPNQGYLRSGPLVGDTAPPSAIALDRGTPQLAQRGFLRSPLTPL